MLKNRLLYLIIYVGFFSNSFGQNLSLNINGENDLETKIIDSLNYSKSHLDYLSIKSEIDSLQKRLYNTGYIESRISKIKKVNDSLFIANFQLKKKYNTIYIYYNPETISKDILELASNNVTEAYFTLAIPKVEKALNLINSEIAKNGFPFTKLKLDNLTVSKNTLEAQLVIDADAKKRTIDNIVVRGYEKFSKSYLKHFLRIRKGDVLDLELIKSKTDNFNNLSFANQLKEPEVLFTKDSTTLYLYLEKQKSNNFDGFLGFGNNEATDKIEFDGYLNLNLTNNLNYGESFSLLYKSDENEQRTFEINFNLPYLFKTPIGTELELNIFRKDSTYTITNQSANIFYQINPKQKAYLGINSTQSSNLLDETTFSSVEDYSALFYKAKYEYVVRDNYSFLFPIEFYLDIEGGYGSRESENTDEQQYSLDLNTFKIFNLNPKNSIYLKLNASSLISDNYLENELRRFGGINSIRGFEENSIFASLHTTLNTEYRFQFSNNLYIHSIIDAAYFENGITEIKEKLFGFGFGFGLLTKSGLLKFNYANGKSENQKFKFSDSKIHLSLTTYF